MFFKLNKSKNFGVELVMLVSLLVIMCVCCILLLAGMLLPQDYKLKKQDTYKIEAVKDNINSNGDFMLGSGYIEEDMYYYFMKIEEDGAYVMDKAKADNSKIYYIEKDEEIRLELMEKKYDWKIVDFLKGDDYQYNFYIPKGSIENNYKVDLE